MDSLNYTETNFRFDIFESEITDVLSACNYINLPFSLPNVGNEINYLLTKCATTFFNNDVNDESLRNALFDSEVVLNFTWEKLNTGHWKDVDKTWREVYSLASIFKVLCLLTLKNSSKLDIIKECDKGLLLGAPIMGHTLSKIAFKLSELLLKESDPIFEDFKLLPKKQKCEEDIENIILKCAVTEKQKIPKEDFISNYMVELKPVVIIKAIADWPALSSRFWNIEYILEKIRFRTVPVELGSKYTDENWTQKLMTVEEFVKKYIWNKHKQKEIGYLAQHNLFLQIPELKDDIITPSYIDENEFVDISIWFGPSGTISPLHYDPKHNLLAQVFGCKYIRLYTKDQSSKLYPRDDPLIYNTSQVDVEDPDFENFPLFKEAIYYETILKPGQLLYIPPECWHYVRSLSTSLSISFWW